MVSASDRGVVLPVGAAGKGSVSETWGNRTRSRTKTPLTRTCRLGESFANNGENHILKLTGDHSVTTPLWGCPG